MSSDFHGIGSMNLKPTKSREDSEFKPGNYVVEVSRFFKKTSQKGERFVIAECKVLESDNGEVKVGDMRSWLQGLQFKSAGHRMMGLRAIGTFAMAALDAGGDDGGMTEENMEQMLGDSNPLRGHKLKIVVTMEPAKNDPTKMYPKFQFHSL